MTDIEDLARRIKDLEARIGSRNAAQLNDSSIDTGDSSTPVADTVQAAADVTDVTIPGLQDLLDANEQRLQDNADAVAAAMDAADAAESAGLQAGADASDAAATANANAATANAAAADAKTRADAAKAAADAAGVSAGSAATAAQNAQAAADAAGTSASAAQATADGKNQVTYSTSTPSDTGNPGTRAGDIWFVRNGNGWLSAQYEWSGSTWTLRNLDSAILAYVDAGKITAGTISADRIGANSITAAKLAADSVTSNAILAGTIQAVDIAAGTITGDRIAAATLTASLLMADTLTSREIGADAILARNIKAAEITGAKIAAATITGGNIATNTITAGNIKAGTITANEIAAGTITADKINLDTLNGKTINGVTINATYVDTRLSGTDGSSRRSLMYAGDLQFQYTSTTGALSTSAVRMTGDTRLAIYGPDNTGIQIGNNTLLFSASDLTRGPDVRLTGGALTIAGDTGNIQTLGNIRLGATADASLTSTGHGFQIGPDYSTNLIMDQNEIMVRNNGSNASLYINTDGGNVGIGNSASTVTVPGRLDSSTIYAEYWRTTSFTWPTSTGTLVWNSAKSTTSAVSISGGVFTINLAGTYLVSCTVGFSVAGAANEYANLIMYVNGSAYKTASGVTSTSVSGANTITAVYSFSAGDTVDFRLHSRSGLNGSPTNDGGQSTFLNITRLGL